MPSKFYYNTCPYCESKDVMHEMYEHYNPKGEVYSMYNEWYCYSCDRTFDVPVLIGEDPSAAKSGMSAFIRIIT